VSNLAELLLRVGALAAVAWVFATLLHALVFSIHVVQSASMVPTLRIGDRVLVVKSCVLGVNPAQGDIVVARTPKLPEESIRREVIKRVLWIEASNIVLARWSWHQRNQDWRPDSARLFIIGDNIDFSRDSRHYGAIPGEDILGLAVYIVWPPKRTGWLTRRTRRKTS